MRMVQRDLHRELRSEATETRERLAELLKPIDAAELNEHPEQDGWSIGQVLEHLCVADERYEAPLANMLRSVRPDAGAPAREWKSSFIGGMIASSLLKPRKLKSPVVFRPGPTPRNGIVEAFLARELEFLKVMDDASSYDWKANRIGSPALPGWAPKMNLGDGFRIHVIHLTRHSAQVQRLAGEL
jgi:hypothetical protein